MTIPHLQELNSNSFIIGGVLISQTAWVFQNNIGYRFGGMFLSFSVLGTDEVRCLQCISNLLYLLQSLNRYTNCILMFCFLFFRRGKRNDDRSD